jgi:hypothetical protein
MLDLVLTNSPDKVITITDEGRLGRSDHIMMILKIGTSLKLRPKKNQIVCWKKGQYENIRENLSLIDWDNQLRGKNTSESWAFLKSTLAEQVKKEIPSFTPSGKYRPQWFNAEIRGLLTAKKKAWKKAKEDNTLKSRSEYEMVEKKLKKKIVAAKRRLEKEIANDKSGNGNKFRNYIKQRTRSRDTVGPLLREDGSTITEDREIAEELNRYFASIFTKEDRTNMPRKHRETEERLSEISFTRSEIIKKIKRLRPDSAAGPDGIHPRLLIECAEQVAIPLSNIFEKSLRENIVPADWKNAIVTPIFKKGKRQIQVTTGLSPVKSWKQLLKTE